MHIPENTKCQITHVGTLLRQSLTGCVCQCRLLEWKPGHWAAWNWAAWIVAHVPVRMISNLKQTFCSCFPFTKAFFITAVVCFASVWFPFIFFPIAISCSVFNSDLVCTPSTSCEELWIVSVSLMEAVLAKLADTVTEDRHANSTKYAKVNDLLDWCQD